MQEFELFQGANYISDAPDKLNKNFQSVMSDFYGAAFPTENLIDGMTCYRSDQGILYRYNGSAWVTELATEAEATAGTNDTKVMTPLKTKKAIEENEKFDEYLPLAGGTMTGNINLSNASIRAIGANSYAQIVGGDTISIAARLNLFGAEYQTAQNAGAFQLLTSSGYTLKGGEDRLLYWDDYLIQGSNNVAYRNAIPRGKDLGTISSVADADAFVTAHGLSTGTFEDTFVLDSVVIKDGTYNVTWLVAGVDWRYNKGDTASGHGIVLIPKTPLKNDVMNDTNTTEGGYAGSKMHTTILPEIVTALQTVLGDHLKSQRVNLSNAIDTSAACKGMSTWKGAASAWSWTDCYAVLPSEKEVYGGDCWSSSGYDTGEANQQLPIFKFINAIQYSRWAFWLRSVASSTFFARCGSNGYATSYGASASGGVRPLIYLG